MAVIFLIFFYAFFLLFFETYDMIASFAFFMTSFLNPFKYISVTFTDE